MRGTSHHAYQEDIFVSWVGYQIDELALLHRDNWLSEVGHASLPALTQVDTNAYVLLSVVLGSYWY